MSTLSRLYLDNRIATAGIFALALALRLIYLAEIRDTPYFATLVLDAYEYDRMAAQILEGDWLADYEEGYVHGLLYPLILALFKAIGGSAYLFAIRLFQAILGALSCVLVHRVAGRLFPHPVPLIAGLLAAAYWPFVFFGGELLATAPVLFVGLLLADLLLRRSPGISTRIAVGTGILMALLVMGRSNTLLLLPVILVWIYLSSRSFEEPSCPSEEPSCPSEEPSCPSEEPATTASSPPASRAILLFLFAVAVALSPFLVRNYLVQGHPLPFQGGWSFYMGNNPEADGTPYARQGLTWQRLERLAGQQESVDPAEKGALYIRAGLRFVRENPGAYLTLLYRKFRLFWNAFEVPVSADLRYYERHSLLARLLVVDFGILVPFALAGMAFCWKQRRTLFLLYGFVLAYLASGLLFSVCARYRLPAVPFLLIFSAAGIWQLVELLRARQLARGSAFLLVLAAAFVLVHTGVDTRQVDHLRSPWLLGHAYLRQQRYGQAEQAYLDGLRQFPNDADMHNSLAVVYQFQKRQREAETAYLKALQIAPDHSRAGINLGKLYLAQRRLPAAQKVLEAALRHDPGPGVRHEAHYNLGYVHLFQEDFQQAYSSFQRALKAQERPLAHYALSNACARLDLGEEQRRALERAVQLDPTFAAAHRNLGALYFQEGDYPAAETALLQAIRHDPASPVAYRHLATLYAQLGKPDQARAAMARARQLSGNR